MAANAVVRKNKQQPHAKDLFVVLFTLAGQFPAAHFSREVLKLGQPIPYGQHRLGIVDVKGGGECHPRYRRGINIHHAQRRMVGHEMTAAFRAVLPVAHARFHEVAD